MDETAKKIKLDFHPFDFENKQHAVYKSENGKKSRYLCGVSSGEGLDFHGEKLTKNAVNKLMEQANSGVVLLYSDIHGIKASEDIGILTKAEIKNNGDWYTEYRLYDESDNVPKSKLDTIDTIWKQINGMPPYPKALQKGFSIEGTVPPGGIIEMSDDGRRVIDNILLDGVVLVPRPAYPTGIAHGVYKCLGELAPWQADIYKNKIRKSLQEKIQDKKNLDNFYAAKFILQDTLEEEIEKAMSSNKLTKFQKQTELNLLFDEYKKSYIDMVMEAPGVFQNGITIHKDENTEARRAKILSSLNKNYEILKSWVDTQKRSVKNG